MARKRAVNNGPVLRNANMIGHGGSGITPVNGSWTQGIQAEKAQVVNFQVAKQRLVNAAHSVATHSMKTTQTVKQAVKPGR